MTMNRANIPWPTAPKAARHGESEPISKIEVQQTIKYVPEGSHPNWSMEMKKA